MNLNCAAQEYENNMDGNEVVKCVHITFVYQQQCNIGTLIRLWHKMKSALTDSKAQTLSNFIHVFVTLLRTIIIDDWTISMSTILYSFSKKHINSIITNNYIMF